MKLDWSSQDSWEFVAEIGFAMVIAGVALEIIDLVAKWKKRHRHESRIVKDPSWTFWVEAISVILVVVGLGIEFGAGIKASMIARSKFGKLEVLAANIGTTNAWLVQSNQLTEISLEEMKSNNVVLEAQLNPRMIEVSSPSRQLKQYAGINAAIVFGQCSDCSSVAGQIAEIMGEANWKIVGIFPTQQPVLGGVSIGICSTNANWDELYGRFEGLDEVPDKHRSGMSPSDFSKLQNASDALAEQLNDGDVIARKETAMNRESNLRFQGIFVLVGPRPSPWQNAADNAQMEYLNSRTNVSPNPSLSLYEERKQFLEVMSNRFEKMMDAQMRSLGTTNHGGVWVLPSGKYP